MTNEAVKNVVKENVVRREIILSNVSYTTIIPRVLFHASKNCVKPVYNSFALGAGIVVL